MEYVKNSIDKRSLHKREHDSRMNERKIQTTEEKVDTSKALEASCICKIQAADQGMMYMLMIQISNPYMMKSQWLRYKRRCCSLIPAESDFVPHAHAQATKTYYKHQDSRIKKAIELKTKTFTNSDIKDNSLKTKLHGRLLERFQEDAKYEHVGQDTRSQGGKHDQEKQRKDLEISKSETKSKDNDKGSRSKITQHEGTSLQHNKYQRFKNAMTKQSQKVQGSKIQDLTSGIQRLHIRGDR
uniref:Uncharacterized protein n=1 Tax=Tanacetum cinerariifolium TaxID=118510 RepID=A0A699HEV7_TANCI|nr:hypothetical protein [Tanacetum cinerariifolium]